jgi:hypothetical protein
MNTLQIFALVLFGISFALILTVLICSAVLFKYLAKQHMSYYKKIGQPTVQTLDPETWVRTWSDWQRNWRGQSFTLQLIFKGLPSDFPKDEKLAKLTTLTRHVGITLYVVFPIMAVLFTYFASQNTAS